MIKRLSLLLSVFLSAGFPQQAHAAETVTYTYDARGRLIKVERVAGRNASVIVTATFDPADNRTQLTVTGQSRINVVVVPLNGFTVIPLP